jgi:hypothetical protein
MQLQQYCETISPQVCSLLVKVSGRLCMHRQAAGYHQVAERGTAQGGSS